MHLPGYRFEPLVLALVALAALPPISLMGPQDLTRYDMTRNLALHGSIEVSPTQFDRSVYHGRSYSDKAPGMSFFAVPAFELERALGLARRAGDWKAEGDFSLWLMRVIASGSLFLLAVFVVGRLGEALASGTGAVTASLFGTATIAAPLAPTFFAHDGAGALAIAAFALLWRGRTRVALVGAGLLAGSAVLFDYQSGLIALALLAYAAWRYRQKAAWYLVGCVPPALALGAYDWVAFGSPLHLSYRYVENAYTERQRSGFFGIGLPTIGGIRDVLFGSRGLLVWSPICAVAVLGVIVLWRRGFRAEALVTGAVAMIFVLVDAGYFLPYGGGSPGPRFLGASLPFLALGISGALTRFRLPVLVLGLVSVVTMTVQALSWGVRRTLDMAYLPGKNDVMATVWSLGGVQRDLGAALVLACALASLGVAVLGSRR